MTSSSATHVFSRIAKKLVSPRVGMTLHSEKGQTNAEYILLVALIAVGLIFVLQRTVKPQYSRMFSRVKSAISDVVEDFDGGR